MKKFYITNISLIILAFSLNGFTNNRFFVKSENKIEVYEGNLATLKCILVNKTSLTKYILSSYDVFSYIPDKDGENRYVVDYSFPLCKFSNGEIIREYVTSNSQPKLIEIESGEEKEIFISFKTGKVLGPHKGTHSLKVRFAFNNIKIATDNPISKKEFRQWAHFISREIKLIVK